MCPPGQGMSGRVYQIDAGWMGGRSIDRIRQLSFFGRRGRGYWSRQTLVLRPGRRVQCFFENVDPPLGVAHFSAQLEAVSRQKADALAGWRKRDLRSAYNLKMLPGGKFTMATSNRVIITCAVTGAIHTPTMSPYLPITPQEIAEAASAAAEAAAA